MISHLPWTAVIPIRAGSKGLPNKNTRPLAGKALYMHAVDLALACNATKIIISTDIEEVLLTEHPAQVQLLKRPSNLCADTSEMAEVLGHAISTANVSGPIVLLQATSPLRLCQDVDQALHLLHLNPFDLVMSVTLAESSVQKWGRVQDGKFLPLSRPKHCFANRQQLPDVYKPNGAIYAMQAQWFLCNGGFVTDRIGALVMPADRSHDIDNLEDFEYCEKLLASQAAE